MKFACKSTHKYTIRVYLKNDSEQHYTISIHRKPLYNIYTIFLITDNYCNFP